MRVLLLACVVVVGVCLVLLWNVGLLGVVSCLWSLVSLCCRWCVIGVV